MFYALALAATLAAADPSAALSGAPVVEISVQVPAPTGAATLAPARFAGLTPLAQKDLGEVRGGQATPATVSGAFSTSTLTAVNAGNSITAGSVVSGGVNLASDAFGGFNGLGNFVINTGNNNNLQGSLTVSVFMAPALPR